MANQYIKPFRDVDPKDVIDLFAFDGSDADKGLFVKVSGTGWKSTDRDLQRSAAGASYSNTVADRLSIAARVTTAGSGDAPLGILLNNVKETDENGEKYLYNPKKKKANDISLSGEAVKVATKGRFLYSGTFLDTSAITAGANAYAAAGGEIATSGTNVVGRFLGAADTDGYVLIQLDM